MNECWIFENVSDFTNKKQKARVQHFYCLYMVVVTSDFKAIPFLKMKMFGDAF